MDKVQARIDDFDFTCDCGLVKCWLLMQNTNLFIVIDFISIKKPFLDCYKSGSFASFYNKSFTLPSERWC